jgi:hypothetical protein
MVLAHAVSLTAVDGWFRPADLASLCHDLHVPRLSNPSEYLKRLQGMGFVTKSASTKKWAVTPLGKVHANDLVGHLNLSAISAEMAKAPGAEFAHVKHAVIDPAFAPPRWGQGISRMLERFPFDTNVFCMTRFPGPNELNEAPDAIREAVSILRDVHASHGLSLHLASDRQLDDDILGNIGAHMWACRYGIGVLEDRVGRGLNYNVVIELGGMLVTGRRCALLKDRTAPTLPIDLAGQIYKSVDLDDRQSISDAVHHWLSEDLALGSCALCRDSISAA